MSTPVVEQRKTRGLRPHPNNVRNHPAAQIERLCASIRQYDFTSPIVVDENDVILAGHARWMAAKKLGLARVPVIVLRGRSEAEKRAYVLFDNKVAELAGYDRLALSQELQDLSALLAPEGLDLSLTGFEPAEIDALLSDFSDARAGSEDEVPPLIANAISRPGDLWRLGDRHRILCADARKADYRRLMGGATAAMVFADPPYNVDIPKTIGRGRTRHRNFAMASGEMSRGEFTGFLADGLRPAVENSDDGALHYICMDWRHYRELLEAGESLYDELINVVVWAKTNAGQGSFYRSQHEEIFVFRAGAKRHLNNVKLGRFQRNRSNLWSYAGANSFRSGRMADLATHPTVKPVGLVADAIRDCTRRGDIVLDPFLGAGTTIVAAERVGRRAHGIEIDPLYVDAAIRRWQAATKADARPWKIPARPSMRWNPALPAVGGAHEEASDQRQKTRQSNIVVVEGAQVGGGRH